jgi:hypothetical protein
MKFEQLPKMPKPPQALRRPALKSEAVLRAMGAREDKDLLADYTPEQQAEIRLKQHILSSLAYFIGKDFRIPVELNEPGHGWHWNFKKNIIKADPKDLLERSLDYLRYVICHEGGHRRVSRTDFIPVEEWRQPGFAFMMNAIEDPRTNNFVADSYPKFREQMALAYQEDAELAAKAKEQAGEKLGYQPRFMQAGFEYIKQWFRETQGQPFAIDTELPEDVRHVVEATLSSAQDSWLRYPSRKEADESEANIRDYAQVSYGINRNHVWPEFKKLIDADLEDQKKEELLKDMKKSEQTGEPGQGIPQKLKESLDPKDRKALEEAIKGAGGEDRKPVDLSTLSEELKKKIADYIETLSPEEKADLMKKARAALKEFEGALNEELGGKLLETPEKKTEKKEAPQEPPEGGGETVRVGTMPQVPLDIAGVLKYKERLVRELNKDANVYEKYRREVLPLIDQLETALREVFVARSTTGWKSGYTIGKRIDVKRRIQEKAKSVPAMESKAWQKRETPQEKDYAISLLVDLSGSMRVGNKITETFKSVIVLAEALNRLGVRVEILGFNDDLYEYQSFGAPMSKEIREHMGGMFKEVEDSCCKKCGNEHAETDLGWATEQAAKRLAKQKEANKLLLTFSDGRLDESYKHPRRQYEAGKMIRDALEEGDISMIGLGIGRGTGNVAKLYPTSIADIDAREMAAKLAGLIKDSISQTP